MSNKRETAGLRVLLGLVALALAVVLGFLFTNADRESSVSRSDDVESTDAAQGGLVATDRSESISPEQPPRPLAASEQEVLGDSPAGEEGEMRVPVLAPEPMSAELTLRVVDRRRGNSVESVVELWRLPPSGSPQLHAELDVSTDGLVLSEIPVGRYRAHVRARRRASNDPPAFRVVAPLTDVALEIEVVGRYEVHLEIRNERGAPIRLGRIFRGYTRMPPFAPDFASDAGGTTPDLDLGTMDFGSRHVSVETEDNRFRLGQVRDTDCDQGGNPYYELRPKARTPVRIELEGHELYSPEFYEPASEVLVLLGVSVPDEWFNEAILLPDGSPAYAAGAQVRCSCQALATTKAALSAGKPWTAVPVRVRVELDGYEPLEFDYRLSEGEPGRRTLVRESF